MLKAVFPCVFKLDKLNVYHIQLHYEFQEIQLAYSNFKKVWDHLFNILSRHKSYNCTTLPIIILLTSMQFFHGFDFFDNDKSYF